MCVWVRWCLSVTALHEALLPLFDIYVYMYISVSIDVHTHIRHTRVFFESETQDSLLYHEAK